MTLEKLYQRSDELYTIVEMLAEIMSDHYVTNPNPPEKDAYTDSEIRDACSKALSDIWEAQEYIEREVGQMVLAKREAEK